MWALECLQGLGLGVAKHDLLLLPAAFSVSVLLLTQWTLYYLLSLLNTRSRNFKSFMSWYLTSNLSACCFANEVTEVG